MQNENDSLNGALTFSCEGNSNPLSKHYSRKLRLSQDNTIIFGRGYDLSSQSTKQIIQDFTAIGMVPKKVDILSKVPDLHRSENRNFIQQYKNDLTLLPEQEARLFMIIYGRLNDQLLQIITTSDKRYGSIDQDSIKPYQWEILLDFLFKGELQSTIQDLLFVTLRKSIERKNPDMFNFLIMDVEYWKRAGVNEDRAKMRSIFVREWNRIISLQNNPQNVLSEKTLVDLLFQSPNLFTLQGFFIDFELDNLDLLLKKLNPHPALRKDSKDDGTNFDDLVLCLKLCYDPSTFSRYIGGSLISPNESNVESDIFCREYYPDKECKRSVIENTHFGDIFNEASLIITQIASGISIREKSNYLESHEEFNYPEELKNAGILPLDVIRSTKKGDIMSTHLIKMKSPLNKILTTPKKIIQFFPRNEQKITRKFVLVARNFEELDTVSNQGEYYLVKEVVLQLEAYKIVTNQKGDVKEILLEDPSDPALLFTKAFNENIELVCKHYPIFKKIQQIYRAMLLTQWLIKKKVPVDLTLVKEFHQRNIHKLPNQKYRQRTTSKIPSLISAKSMVTETDEGSMYTFQDLDTSSPYKYKNKGSFIFNDASPSPERGSLSPSKINRPISPTKLNRLSPLKRTESPSHKNSFILNKLMNPGTKVIIRKHSNLSTFDGNQTNEGIPFPSNRNVYVYAGVILDFQAKKTSKYEALINPDEIETKSPLFKGRSLSKNKSTQKINSGSNRELENPNLCTIIFPFQKSTCLVCENYLKYTEVTSPFEGRYYCRLHHPSSCNYCFNICKDQFVVIQGAKYHQGCLKCKHCGGYLKEQLIHTKQGFIHKECITNHLKDLCETNKLNELFVGETGSVTKKEGMMKRVGIMKKRDLSVGRLPSSIMTSSNKERRVQLMVKLNKTIEDHGA